MADPTQGFVVVRDESSEVLRVPLQGSRMVIGRADHVPVCLPEQTVSREHAEMFSDPFGRWWIRDLGSRNGTIVNGKRTEEHLIEPGDTIQIEQFTITLNLDGPARQRPRTGRSSIGVTLSDMDSANVARLADFESPKIDASHLTMLTEFAGNLLSTEDPDARLEALCKLMVGKEFSGNAAMALRISLTDEKAEPEVIRDPIHAKNWRSDEQPYISRTMLRNVRESNAPVIASNVSAGGKDVVEISLASNVVEMAAVMCPLRRESQTMDVLYVTLPGAYGTGEWLSLAALASRQYEQAEEVWEARDRAEQQAVIEKELLRAQQIQMSLIPRDATPRGLDIAIGFEPCRWVGGDYVDVVELPDGRQFVTVCDVCGKGMQAALITACLHTSVHMNAQAGLPLPQFMKSFNDYLCDTLPDESFVTAICLMIDPATGAMELCNAGHPPGMIAFTGPAVKHLESAQNPPLGYLPVDFELQQATLEPGEVLALYTDGYTEMNNEDKDMLGIEGVDDCLKRSYAESESIATLGDRFKQSLTAYQGNAPAMDDLTFILLRRAAE